MPKTSKIKPAASRALLQRLAIGHEHVRKTKQSAIIDGFILFGFIAGSVVSGSWIVFASAGVLVAIKFLTVKKDIARKHEFDELALILHQGERS